MKILLARIYQKVLYIFSKLIKFRKPELVFKLNEIVDVLKKYQKKNIMLVNN